MNKILTGITVAFVLLSAVGINTVYASDHQLQVSPGAQPYLPVSVEIGSLSSFGSSKIETSRNQGLDACEASKLIEKLYLVLTADNTFKFGPVQGTNGVISVSEDRVVPSYHTESVNEWLSKNFPEIKSREELLSLLRQAGWKYQTEVLSDVKYIKPPDWKDPCAGKGGGGGLSLQFSAEYIWLLILIAILGLAAIKIIGGKLISI